MEVILLERIEKLGQMGDVVTVKPGFARNYLLPQRKALRATPENRESFENRRSHLEAENLARRDDAEAVGQKLEGLTITVIRQAGESGQLYGSVSAKDVAEAVTEAGFAIERGQVRMDRVIKVLGLSPVRVALHPEVAVTVTVNVAKSREEAEMQLAQGKAVAEAEHAAEDDAARAARAAAETALAIADDKVAEVEAAEGLVEEEVARKLATEAADEEPPEEKEQQEAKRAMDSEDAGDTPG